MPESLSFLESRQEILARKLEERSAALERKILATFQRIDSFSIKDCGDLINETFEASWEKGLDAIYPVAAMEDVFKRATRGERPVTNEKADDLFERRLLIAWKRSLIGKGRTLAPANFSFSVFYKRDPMACYTGKMAESLFLSAYMTARPGAEQLSMGTLFEIIEAELNADPALVPRSMDLAQAVFNLLFEDLKAGSVMYLARLGLTPHMLTDSWKGLDRVSKLRAKLDEMTDAFYEKGLPADKSFRAALPFFTTLVRIEKAARQIESAIKAIPILSVTPKQAQTGPIARGADGLRLQ